MASLQFWMCILDPHRFASLSYDPQNMILLGLTSLCIGIVSWITSGFVPTDPNNNLQRLKRFLNIFGKVMTGVGLTLTFVGSLAALKVANNDIILQSVQSSVPNNEEVILQTNADTNVNSINSSNAIVTDNVDSDSDIDWGAYDQWEEQRFKSNLDKDNLNK